MSERTDSADDAIEEHTALIADKILTSASAGGATC